MSDRRFGVELEFCGGDLGRAGVLDVLRRSFDSAGFRRWYFDDRLGYDGSEFELRTPVLRGQKGFDQLKLVMETLDSEGCYTTSDDGMHVHHDAPEFVNDMGNCVRLVKSWQANKHLIYQFVEHYRTVDDYGESNGYWACPHWSKGEIDKMEASGEIPTWERKDLNLTSLFRHGSIEIRLHEGTLHYPEAESWIKFGQKFIDRAVKYQIRDSKDTDKLLKKIRVAPGAQKMLIDKAKWNRL